MTRQTLRASDPWIAGLLQEPLTKLWLSFRGGARNLRRMPFSGRDASDSFFAPQNDNGVFCLAF